MLNVVIAFAYDIGSDESFDTFGHSHISSLHDSCIDSWHIFASTLIYL